MLFAQFVHAAVVDAAHDHRNHDHFHMTINDGHHHDHSDTNENHDDDQGFGSLHNAMHDLQTIAPPANLSRSTEKPAGATRSMPMAEINKGLTLSPPVPPPLG